MCLLSTHTQDIPSTGLDKWFDLNGRSAKSSVEGQLRLQLSLTTREDCNFSNELKGKELREHLNMESIFLQYDRSLFQVPFLIFSA
jgi:BAI1-associated protein 3